MHARLSSTKAGVAAGRSVVSNQQKHGRHRKPVRLKAGALSAKAGIAAGWNVVSSQQKCSQQFSGGQVQHQQRRALLETGISSAGTWLA